MSRTVEVTELVLRDGHQSLLATRMALEDMVAACEDIDQAGYWSVECWGGATYDSCIRFLNEDPWERLRTFRKLMPNTPPADAPARPEPARLPPLRGHGRRSVRGQVGGERHGRVPRLRRAQRHPQPPPGPGGRASHRQARRGHHLLHDVAAAHGRQVRRDGPAAPGPGLRLDLHQGHGGPAEAPTRLRPRPRHQGEVRRGHASSTCTSTPRRASRWSA